ncbi:MAG TPA: FAD-dependent oxidoreductase [Verrucomicrobiae bacterium]|nr:FAD-dependent oxidoreductase [Verrucomicrobiae bacterium]
MFHAKDQRPAFGIKTAGLVIGGGAAGMSAAITAARKGVGVVLVERYGFCGGAAVAGLSGTVCGLYAARDNRERRPEQVVFGFADEFVRRMERAGGITGPIRYGKTFTRVHDPLVWRKIADGWLQEAGVKIFYHALATQVLMERDRVEGVKVWTKQGLCEIRAKLTIDASGDADLFAMGGLKTVLGNHGKVQNPTMIFRIQGVDMERFLAVHGADSIMGEGVMNAIQAEHSKRRRYLPRSKVFLFPTPRKNELLCNATRVIGRDGRELNPLIADDLTEAEIEGRRQVWEYADFFREHIAGCENSYVNDTGVQVGVRQTRQISGTCTLTNEDVVRARKRKDGIARSPWPIELHSGDKPHLHWVLEDYYEVPFGCFVPEKGEGLLAAGRCLSAQHEAMASARVTAQCFSYGQAIGLAAVVAVQENLSPRQLSGQDIRSLLNREGAALDS